MLSSQHQMEVKYRISAQSESEPQVRLHDCRMTKNNLETNAHQLELGRPLSDSSFFESMEILNI